MDTANELKELADSIDEANDGEKCITKLPEKEAHQNQAKKTAEIFQIDPTLLTCPSTALLCIFDKYLNTLLEAKSTTASSLTCYQIVLNSLMSLHSKQYPNQSKQELQELVNSLLHKIFHKMRGESIADAGHRLETANLQNKCELLCLLEMHLLRFSPSITNHNIHASIKGSPTSLNGSIASTSSGLIINFIAKTNQKKERPKSPIVRMTPSQLATKNVVSHLRQLYLICANPNEFAQFLEDVLCDEFIEELPFYLASIFEQLAIAIPLKLRSYLSQDIDQPDLIKTSGRRFQLDLSEYKNKRADKLEKFLLEMEQTVDNREDEEEEIEDKENEKRKRKDRGMERGRADRTRKKMEERLLVMAPKKQRVPSKSGLGRFRMDRSRQSGLTKKIDPPAGIAALKMSGDQLAKRRIFQTVPETPEKKIWPGRMNRQNDCGIANEIVEQTPLGKINTDSSSLAAKLAELLIRGEAQMNKMEQEFIEEMSTISSVPPPLPLSSHQREMMMKKFSGDEIHSSTAKIDNKRKRPLTPSEDGFSLTDLLHIKQQQQVKKPRRRLFPSSRSSTSSAGMLSFPFTDGATNRKS